MAWRTSRDPHGRFGCWLSNPGADVAQRFYGRGVGVGERDLSEPQHIDVALVALVQACDDVTCVGLAVVLVVNQPFVLARFQKQEPLRDVTHDRPFSCRKEPAKPFPEGFTPTSRGRSALARGVFLPISHFPRSGVRVL